MPSITSWNRLEPRARAGDMRPGLEAQIHDPLWLLARQWQLGEFQGEDAGSPVWVRLRGESAHVTAYGDVPYDGTIPLETLVERDPGAGADLRSAAEAGLRFLELLDAEEVGHHRQAFLRAYPLPPATGDEDSGARRYRLVMTGRAPDGWALAAALRGGLPVTPTIPPADRDAVTRAADRYLAWFDSLTSRGPQTSAWQPSRFEHRFAVAARSEGAEVVLTAHEHLGGPLDWYAFDHDTNAALGAAARSTSISSTTLPTRVTYAGMPASRYWELEDRRVDFGGVEAAPTDLARMLVLDFATIYGNDWYVVPLTLDLGTLTNIRSLVVGDTFGGMWSIASAAEPGWSMYELSTTARTTTDRLARLFLPPALPAALESEPMEEVLLLRDEDANLAWAIEHTVEGAAGNRIDRTQARHDGPRVRAGAETPIAPLVYRVATDVPENWIPLIPEEIRPGENVLRVSVIKRDPPTFPQGILLGAGEELLIPEEEVPMEGARLTRTWQYARWTDGTAHLWAARAKHPGRGPASSGLAFDIVEPWQP